MSTERKASTNGNYFATKAASLFDECLSEINSNQTPLSDIFNAWAVLPAAEKISLVTEYVRDGIHLGGCLAEYFDNYKNIETYILSLFLSGVNADLSTIWQMENSYFIDGDYNQLTNRGQRVSQWFNQLYARWIEKETVLSDTDDVLLSIYRREYQAANDEIDDIINIRTM
jgi:hypothetical protein